MNSQVLACHRATEGRGVPVTELTRFVPVLGAAVAQLQARAAEKRAMLLRADAEALHHLALDLAALRSLIVVAETIPSSGEPI